MSTFESSPDFTIEDIHNIREENYEVTKEMTLEEQSKYYHRGADAMLRRIAEKRSTQLAQ